MTNLLKYNITRHLLSMLIALFIAVIVNYYFAATKFYLIPIAALIVMQTPIGNVLFQSTKLFLILFLGIAAVALFFKSKVLFINATHDALIGAVIGMIAHIFVFARRADSAFRMEVLPVLQAQKNYFLALTVLLFEENMAEIEAAQQTLEKTMLQLPAWVFKRGFDSGLQKGHQFFLIKIAEISEVLFAMHHVTRYVFADNSLQYVREDYYVCANAIEEYFVAITKQMNLIPLENPLPDFAKDLAKLEKQFQETSAVDLELIYIRMDESYFSELIYLLNELRNALLKLIQALR